MTEDEPSTLYLLKLLAPILALTVATSVALSFGLLKASPLGALIAGPSVASFDVLKYTNAQRAVASAFLKPNSDVSRTNELLYKLPERTRQAILEVAGTGTLVVVKQAVVQGQTADITDAVLARLGLPTNVPTEDGTASSMGYAPTMLGALPVKPAEPRGPLNNAADNPLP